MILSADVADGVLNRIDRVVLRLDFLNREIKTIIKKGTFASNPVAPELQRDSDVYELGVADIHIGKGAISITQSNITDLRMNTNLCGLVNSLIQADTTAIFNQYLDWYNSKKNDYEGWYSSTTNQYQTDMSNMELQFQNNFNTWFDSVKNTLGSDVAGNLLNQINSLAGEGRSTETVKGNADAIKSLDEKVVSHLADNTKHITSTERNNWNNKIDSSKIGAVNGVASLGNDGKILIDEVPSLNSGAWEKIADVTLQNITTSIIFNSIPKYKFLRATLELFHRATDNAMESLYITFNNNRSNIYYYNAGNSSYTGKNKFEIGSSIPSDTALAVLFAIVDIDNFDNKYKNIMGRGTTRDFYLLPEFNGQCKLTDTITSIEFTKDAYFSREFAIGSRITLWGCK